MKIIPSENYINSNIISFLLNNYRTISNDNIALPKKIYNLRFRISTSFDRDGCTGSCHLGCLINRLKGT